MPVFVKLFCAIVFAMGSIFMPSASAAEGKRVALVIGNSDYQHVSNLPNSANDARDISLALGRVGFDVTEGIDLDYRAMRLAVRDFALVARDAETVLIYFAGHGIEIDNTNFLVPVNAELKSDVDVELEAIRLDTVVNSVAVTNGLKVVLVDACRNNPFLTKMTRTSTTRSIGRGLGRVDPGGVLVGYAARAGTLALDGDGRNSPYAQALLEHIEEPGLEIGRLFRKVRSTVLSLTDGYQEPFTYGSLPDREIYLVPATQTTQQKETKAPDPHLTESPLVLACDRLASDPDDLSKPNGPPGVIDENIELEVAIPACKIATEGHPQHARSFYNLARVELLGGNTEASVNHFREAARLGHSLARVKLGKLLLQSDNNALVEEGILFFETEARGGNAEFAKILGDHFSGATGSSVPKNDKAMFYYEIAASAGDPDSMFQIGQRLVSNTLSTKEQITLGLEFLNRAATAGNIPAQNRLANEYFAHENPNTRQKATVLFEAAASAGDTHAQRRLIQIYSGKSGFTENAERYAFWVLALADSGESRFNVEAGWNYEVGRGVKKNPEQAAKYYYAALRNGESLPLERSASDWDKDTAKEMQRLLSFYWEARYAGPIDGLIGKDTITAMQRVCECAASSRLKDFSKLFSH
jgi:TPR repeat protein